MHAVNTHDLPAFPLERTALPEPAQHVAVSIEREAWRDLAYAAVRAVPELALEAEVIAGALVLRSRRIDSLLFNRTIGLSAADCVTDADVAAIVRSYRDRSIERFWIHADASENDGACARLERLGLERHSRLWTKFMRDVRPFHARPSTLRLRPATPDDAFEVAQIVAPAFDMPANGGTAFSALINEPAWHVLVATDRERIAAVAGLYVSGSVGYHAFAATRPEYRNRGAQSLLIEARITTARALGCHWLVTETGAPRSPDEANPSYQNILRTGFVPVGQRLNYGLPGTTWS